MLSKELIAELAQIAHEEWNWILSEQEATELAHSLVTVYRALLDV